MIGERGGQKFEYEEKKEMRKYKYLKK